MDSTNGSVKDVKPADHSSRRRKPGGRAAGMDPRSRLIAAMLACVGEQGYDTTTVADVIAGAVASRKTFYEYFADKHTCFMAMADEVVGDWLAHIERTLERTEGEAATVEMLVEEQFLMAIERPAALRVLVAELTAAGSDGLARREQALGELARPLSAALGDDSPEGLLRARAIVGAILRIPYARARHGARVRRPRRTALMALAPEVAEWALSYHGEEDGATGKVKLSLNRGGARVPVGGRAPGTLSLGSRGLERRGLPRGDGSVSRSFVVHSQRERILDALANLSAAQGYGASTIPEIVKEAAVSVQAFYEHFSGKEDVFLVAYEIGHRKARAIVERAYESHDEWPDAVRAGIEALLDFLASEPSFAHLAIVDALTASPKAASAAEEGTGAYAALLEPGLTFSFNGNRPAAAKKVKDGERPSLVRVEATAGALLELCLTYVATERVRELPNLADLAGDLALRPFLGVHAG